MRRHLVLLVILLLGNTATTCVAFSAIAVAPSRVMDVEETGGTAFPIVARIVARHHLEKYQSPTQDREHWAECFTRETFFLCGKVYEGEIQFRIYQARTPRFTRWADSLRLELMDSLRVQFGNSRVRECDWLLSHDPKGSGCPPITAPTTPSDAGRS